MPFPIAALMGLAQLVGPKIVEMVAGKPAGKAAKRVADIANAITGTSDPDEALAALQADPALLAAYQQAVLEQETELERLYLEDRADARERDVALRRLGQRNWRADLMVLAAFASVTVIAVVAAIWSDEIGQLALGFITTVGGMFARNIGTAFDFEFGSSRGSKEKDRIIGEARP